MVVAVEEAAVELADSVSVGCHGVRRDAEQVEIAKMRPKKKRWRRACCTNDAVWVGMCVVDFRKTGMERWRRRRRRRMRTWMVAKGRFGRSWGAVRCWMLC